MIGLRVVSLHRHFTRHKNCKKKKNNFFFKSLIVRFGFLLLLNESVCIQNKRLNRFSRSLSHLCP